MGFTVILVGEGITLEKFLALWSRQPKFAFVTDYAYQQSSEQVMEKEGIASDPGISIVIDILP